LKFHPDYLNQLGSNTLIQYSIERGGKIELSVFNLDGRKVKSEDLGFLPPGRYHHQLNMAGYGSGNYIVEISLDVMYRDQGVIVLIE